MRTITDHIPTPRTEPGSHEPHLQPPPPVDAEPRKRYARPTLQTYDSIAALTADVVIDFGTS